MVLIKNLITSMKVDFFDDALSNALPIFDSKKNEMETGAENSNITE